MAANDSSAAASERSIVTAEVAYYATFPTLGCPAALTTLGGAVGVACVPSQLTACLLDNNLSNNGPGDKGKSGYNFAAAGIGAVPVNTFLTTGTRSVRQPAARRIARRKTVWCRTQAVGVITIVGTYAARRALNPLAN